MNSSRGKPREEFILGELEVTPMLSRCIGNQGGLPLSTTPVISVAAALSATVTGAHHETPARIWIDLFHLDDVLDSLLAKIGIQGGKLFLELQGCLVIRVLFGQFASQGKTFDIPFRAQRFGGFEMFLPKFIYLGLVFLTQVGHHAAIPLVAAALLSAIAVAILLAPSGTASLAVGECGPADSHQCYQCDYQNCF